MQPSPSSLSELLNSLDAATYFFISSGTVIGVTAVLFFAFGVWLGRLLWGRYKRRLRDADEVIEAFKGEVALLKRRIAEQATRPLPSMGPSPLQSIAFKAVAPSLRPTMESLPVTLPPTLAAPLPGRAFTVWTETGWKGPKPQAKRLPASRAFSLWAEPPARKEEPAVASLPAPLEAQPLPAIEVFMVPRSRAFSIWTDKDWKQPAAKAMPLRPGAPFALWTQPDFKPACRGILLPSKAHAIWTTTGWSAPRISGPPPRSARAFCVWTEPGWEPRLPLPRSTAFSLWTLPDFVPTGRGPALPGMAHSVWTAPGWTAPPVKPQPLPPARPFSVWAEPPLAVRSAPAKTKPTSQAAIVAAAASAVASIAAKPSAGAGGKGFMARALAAAKNALRLGAAPVEEPPQEEQTPRPVAQPRPSGASVTKPAPAQPAVPVTAPTKPKSKQAPPSSPAPEPLAPAPAKPATVAPPAPAPAPAASPEAAVPTGKAAPAPPVKSAPPPIAAQPATEPPAALPPVPATPPVTTVKAAPASPRKPVAKPAGPPPTPEPRLVPAKTAEPAKVSVKPPPPVPAVIATLSATAAAVEALRTSGRVPVMAAPDAASLPPASKAFSLWTGESSAAPVKTITQRVALAALIESKVATGRVPLPPMPAPAPAVPAPAPKAEPVLSIPAIPAIKTSRVPAAAPTVMAGPVGPFASELSSGTGRNDLQLGFVYTSEPAQKDSLTSLSCLDEATRDLLHNNGVYTFKQIALWTPAQAEAFSQRLGTGDRISREKWSELAKGWHTKLHGEEL